MYKELKLYTLLGTIFTLIFGTLLHFLFQWTGESPYVAWFAPVSESIWEHLKLLFFPIAFYTIPGIFFFRNTFQGLFGATVLGTFGGMLSILILYYTYSGILGQNFLILDIACFFISVILSFTLMNYLIRNLSFSRGLNIALFLLFLLFFLSFVLFTWYPPSLSLFQNPDFSVFQNRAMIKLVYLI